MRHQLETGLGIFACDEYGVFTDHTAPWTVGPGPLGMLSTIHFQSAPVGYSKDGTAGNALLFMHVWEVVINDGRWSQHDWTVKVDPDAVMFPDRLRLHVKQHNGKKAWIANCNAFPSSSDFPMMYGALEVISSLHWRLTRWTSLGTSAANMNCSGVLWERTCSSAIA
jgi:hypothetical protein